MNMDYENYIELYEAIYFFDRIHSSKSNKPLEPLKQEALEGLGLNESIYIAMMRILVVNDMIDYDGNCFVLTEQQRASHQDILDNIISRDASYHYRGFFDKGVHASQFFFNSINEAEYEVYSRYNFQITAHIGQEVAKHIELNNKKVLELGGNSGGLATTLLKTNEECIYTIVDTKIPCRVGNELKQVNHVDLTFIERDVFELNLKDERYDYVIMMNFLHDFDDIKCLKILRNGMNSVHGKTKIVVIEDILHNAFEPKEVIMHGLRLAVECRGGRQRTIEEFGDLFAHIDYQIEKVIKINSVHTMLVAKPCAH